MKKSIYLYLFKVFLAIGVVPCIVVEVSSSFSLGIASQIIGIIITLVFLL